MQNGVLYINGEPRTLEPRGAFVEETYDRQGPPAACRAANAPVGRAGLRKGALSPKPCRAA
jgi:hypothetical protein